MAVNGLSPESMMAIAQAKDAQRRQQEAAQKASAAQAQQAQAQQAQQAQQGAPGAAQPGAATNTAAKPATDVGAACDHNNAVAQKWDGFRGPENKVDAVANPGNMADTSRDELYKKLGDDRATKAEPPPTPTPAPTPAATPNAAATPAANAAATPAANKAAAPAAARPEAPKPADAAGATVPLAGAELVNAQRAGVAAATAKGEKFEVLSEANVKDATAQLQKVDGQLTEAKTAVAQKRGEIDGQVKSLEALPSRTTPQEALLQGKKGQSEVLKKAEQHLDDQKAVVGAAINAVSDGVATEGEGKALTSARTALEANAKMLGALDNQASNLVKQAEAAGATVPNAKPEAMKDAATTTTTPEAAAAKTGLDKTLADNPAIKSNQDLINHYYKAGGGTWEGASKLASADGASINKLVRDRQGVPGSAAAPSTGATGPSGPAGTTGPAATTVTTPTTTTPEKEGVNRSIRPFREVDQKKLEAALPANAKHLAKSFIDEGRKNNIDPVALAAISKHETGNFTSSAFKNKNNAMGISDKNGPTQQKSAEDSIAKMAKGLANPNGYYKGKNTIGEIANTYAPIGANNDPTGLNNHWGKGVAKFADDFASKVRPEGTTPSTSTAPGTPGTTATTGPTATAPAAGSINERIDAATKKYMGTSTRNGPDGGNLACAFAVNNILKDAGFKKIGSNTNLVRSVEADLKNGRGTPVSASQARPGDIVIWPAPRSHIGIMSDNGKVANNSSSKASFTNMTTLPPGARIYRVTN
ncbi:MAG: hypothetical protein Q8O67_15715 [Deltaproteobacteria bacterium]|nr:hypothetical protein [Deltaproteobacteria bacterium]